MANAPSNSQKKTVTKKTVSEDDNKKPAFQFKNPYGWFDTRAGAITAIAASFGFIAIFVTNIIVNHTWISAIFVILYGLIIVNRLKLLRNMHD